MLKRIFMLLKPKLNTSGCMYEQIVILKNCIIVRTIQCTWLPKMSTVTGSNSTIQSTGQQNSKILLPSHNRSASMFQSWNQAFRITGFLGWCPNINPAWCWEWLIWPYYALSIIRQPGFMIITPSFASVSIVFSNQRFSNYSSTIDVGIVNLSSDCFCGNGLQDEYWVLLSPLPQQFHDFLDTILFNLWRSLSLSFGFGCYSP